jgi:hypothetical protein
MLTRESMKLSASSISSSAVSSNLSKGGHLNITILNRSARLSILLLVFSGFISGCDRQGARWTSADEGTTSEVPTWVKGLPVTADRLKLKDLYIGIQRSQVDPSTLATCWDLPATELDNMQLPGIFEPSHAELCKVPVDYTVGGVKVKYGGATKANLFFADGYLFGAGFVLTQDLPSEAKQAVIARSGGVDSCHSFSEHPPTTNNCVTVTSSHGEKLNLYPRNVELTWNPDHVVVESLSPTEIAEDI